MRHGNFEDQPDAKMNWHVVKFIWPYLLEYKQRVIIALLCMVLAKVANVAGPYLLKLVVDALNREDTHSLLIIVPVALILAYGFARFLNVLMGEIRDTVLAGLPSGPCAALVCRYSGICMLWI